MLFKRYKPNVGIKKGGGTYFDSVGAVLMRSTKYTLTYREKEGQHDKEKVAKIFMSLRYRFHFSIDATSGQLDYTNPGTGGIRESSW